jgi:fructose-1,6-bisphosphatase I
MNLHSVGDEGAGAQIVARFAAVDGALSADVAVTIGALASGAARIAALIGQGSLAAGLADDTGASNTDGDNQKRLDVLSNDAIISALGQAPVAYFASEEEEAILSLDPHGSVAVAVDPLDGSSNISSNVSIGTIFAIFPAATEGASASFFRCGDDLLAAGYFIYGPHTSLVVSIGQGVDIFVLDPVSGQFRLTREAVKIPDETREFAINVSNYRYWHHPVRLFVDDCMAGHDGPRGRDYNMRWVASLVAEAHRILARGGVFLYPADHRAGYSAGRLRLLYEAFPIAFIAEQAGGSASDTARRILSRTLADLHQRTPLVFGCAANVKMVDDYHLGPKGRLGEAPLFGRRGLYRK